MKQKLNNSMRKVIGSDETAKILYSRMCENGNDKTKLLWEILFELDVAQIGLMNDKIYQFGRELKEKDAFERIIFVRLVQMLNQLEMYNVNL